MTGVEIIALFDEWNNALQTREPEQVANLYASNVILLSTMSRSATLMKKSKIISPTFLRRIR